MTKKGEGAGTGGSGSLADSGAASGSAGSGGSDVSRGSAGSRGSRGSAGKGSAGSKGSGDQGGGSRDVGQDHLCTFVVAGQKYALSTALIRELVEVTTLTVVPRTDVALLGLFNLRGEPMPLVDMAMILGTGVTPPAPKMPVMIVRSEKMSVGARIDSLGIVVPNAGLVTNNEPNPLLLGFVSPTATSGAIAVINPVEFLSRLDRLKRTTSERGVIG